MKATPKGQAQDTLDRTTLSVAGLGDEPDQRAYWHSRTPQERLLHVEELRRPRHGTDATARLQSDIEIGRTR